MSDGMYQLLTDLRINASGAIGLLCECSIMLGSGADAEEVRDNIERCVDDWCKITGWTYRRTLQRIEVFPP